MRSGKFWLFLLVVFLAVYWWAGGNSIPKYIQSKTTTPSIAIENSSVAEVWERIYRIVALRNAVQAKIDKHNYTSLKNIPLPMQQAIIAVEDNRFYNHLGFDIEGILRATLVNIQTGELQEGGSTITQQLVKNLFLTQDRTWSRKAEEVLLAVDMELRYSKEEILEIYLNTIYFGSGATGINQAARVYFDKSPAALGLAESAMLAGLPNAPSAYSPYVDFAAAKQRQSVVLAAMVKYGYIGPSLAQEARTTPLYLAR